MRGRIPIEQRALKVSVAARNRFPLFPRSDAVSRIYIPSGGGRRWGSRETHSEAPIRDYKFRMKETQKTASF